MSYSKGLHEIEINKLKLDPGNPRLPERLMEADEHEVLNWMLSDATLTDLMASIVENGFFGGEALVGINDTQNKDSIIIVEGNRRLAAVKVLNNPTIIDVKTRTVNELTEEAKSKGNLPKILPVYIVNNRDEVANYLGFRHVTGVKQWPVIAKARYIFALFKARKWTIDIYKQLAKEIGSKGVYVRRLIIGYQLFEYIRDHAFYDLDYLNEENFDLSLINDAGTKYNAIAEYIGIDTDSPSPINNIKPKEFQNVFEWLYKRNEKGETRLGESRNLPVLNKILESKEASRAFIKDKYSLEDAAALTALADENVRWHLQNARFSMIESQKMVHNIKAPNRSDIRLVDEIRSSAETIRREMSEKLLSNSNEN